MVLPLLPRTLPLLNHFLAFQPDIVKWVGIYFTGLWDSVPANAFYHIVVGVIVYSWVLDLLVMRKGSIWLMIMPFRKCACGGSARILQLNFYYMKSKWSVYRCHWIYHGTISPGVLRRWNHRTISWHHSEAMSRIFFPYYHKIGCWLCRLRLQMGRICWQAKNFALMGNAYNLSCIGFKSIWVLK